MENDKVIAYASRQLIEYEKKVSYLWLGTSSSGICTEYLETLSLWEEMSYLHRPQEPQVLLYAERIKYETKEMT